jgi:hypothetical protein
MLHRFHRFPVYSQPAKRVWLTPLLVGIGFMVSTAAPDWADPRVPDSEMKPGPVNETGFTLGELLDPKLWVLARSPLSPETLEHVSVDAHQPPHQGVQFELFTPGDFGATVHIRW